MLILIIFRPQYSYEVREELCNRVGLTEAHLKFLVGDPGIVEISMEK